MQRPLVPEDVQPSELDREARQELRSLPKDLADTVAGHLVMTGRLIDERPAEALAHAREARRLAGRVAAVREAAGVAAYINGDYADALSELRAVRRMTGYPDHLPLMADCERGLGRPERAIALAADPDARRLDPESAAELRIIVSGARRDLGQAEAAVAALEGPDLDSGDVQPWTPRLYYAYADALLAAGRTAEAVQWFTAVAGIDDGETDAEERLAELDDDGS
ncbi:MAG: hypothetical protein M3P91_06310 [Actinomycetota bacterium]|nr:hypothetical protein [Actinomycetota bacterium]